jgi:site-specific recombinase XerD
LCGCWSTCGARGGRAGAEARPVTELEELIDDYREWLIVERALASNTLRRYERLARRFLEQRTAVAGGVGVRGLIGADVTGFLLGECARLSVGSARVVAADLRSLLRFLRLRGLTDMALGESVPPVASWRDATVPGVLARGEVEGLLAGCDRSTVVGARDSRS